MLKWTVMARREAEKSDPLRRRSAISGTALTTTTTIATSTGAVRIENEFTPRTQAKRRRAIRSRTSKRSSIFHRNSVDLEIDKENQFTSTPIKSYDDNDHHHHHHHQCDVLRDVSNLTPNDPNFGRVLSAKKCKKIEKTTTTVKQQKRKKSCLDPGHKQQFHHMNDQSNYFRPFETVDSHIKGLSPDHVQAGNCDHVGAAKRPIQDVYAPTLPIYGMEYSPCIMPGLMILNSSPLKQTPLGKLLNLNDNGENVGNAVKRPKIDHVNDFLYQISDVQSPEFDNTRFEVKSNCNNDNTNIDEETDEIKVTPLVKKFVELRFSQISSNDSSSLINDLSLEKIVDAILDSTIRNDNNNVDDQNNYCNLSTAVNLDSHEQCQLQIIENDRKSDSDFKSTIAEYSHRLEGNFVCQQCNNNPTKVSVELNCDKTIININETFNERCVDVTSKSKKRSLSLSPISTRSKDDDCNINFTLKRQRCIRRRKTETDDRMIFSNQKRSPLKNMVSNHQLTDESFNITTISGKISDCNKSTPNKITSYSKETTTTTTRTTDRTFTFTPVDTNRRFRRCLQFESPPTTTTTTTTSFSDSASATNCSSSIGDEARGTIDLNIRCCGDEDVLYVNIIRCKDLYRSNGNKQINAYVKVAFNDRYGSDNNNRRKHNDLLQRTPVLSNSTKPFFNHTFKFPIEMENLDKRIHIEVWHRDRAARTSEFLGCMFFDVRHAYTKEISGSYRLLPQSTGRRTQNISITPQIQLINNKPPIDYHQSTTTTTTFIINSTMCESQSSVDEIINIDDDLDYNDLKKTTNKSILNEQQKYADENLFLRYLELDPLDGPDAIPAAMQRKATGNKNGRTPFTHTKRLIRPPKSGFGFSVVWTHPPRIERVEKGLPADKAGILPGDYIIFVDKHNVVMMPEIDILNLIRSYGNQLTLEIFRRNTSRNGSVPNVRRLNSTGTCSSTTGLPINPNVVQRRPSTVCSTNTTSVDYSNRKKLHLPQVTFTTEVGSGIIV